MRDGRLYAGMRGPVLDDGSAFILSVPLGALFEAQPGNATSHRVRLGKDTRGDPRGIRDLVAFGSGFVIVAGPVKDPPTDEVNDADYAIFSYDGKAANRLPDSLVVQPLERNMSVVPSNLTVRGFAQRKSSATRRVPCNQP